MQAPYVFPQKQQLTFTKRSFNISDHPETLNISGEILAHSSGIHKTLFHLKLININKVIILKKEGNDEKEPSRMKMDFLTKRN